MSSAQEPILSPPAAVIHKEDDRSDKPSYSHGVAIRVPDWLRLTDGVIALGFVAAAGIETVIRHPGNSVLIAMNAPGSILLGSLALRRTRPLLAVAILTAGAAVGTLLEVWLAPPQPGTADAVVPVFALLLLTYSLGAYGTARELAIGAVLPLVLVVGIDLSEPSGYPLLGALPFFAVFVVGAPALVGRLVRVRTTLLRQLKEQEHHLHEERAANTGAALALERLHLSERLHGSLEVGMASLVARSAMVREADASQQLQAIAAIESGARALLSDTRKVVVSLASQPGAQTAEPRRVLAGPVESRTRIRDARNSSLLPWAAVAGAATCVGLMLETRTTQGLRVVLPIAFLSCLFLGIPLVLIWTRPLLMTAAFWVEAALFSAQVAPLAPMFTAISFTVLLPFAVAYLERRRPAVLALGICYLGELACFGPEPFLSNAALGLGAWVAGRILREASRLVTELRSSNLQLAEQREATLREAVLMERARVARELHDSTGHALTVVALQAGAARRLWASDRSRATEALRTLERIARSALYELQLPIGVAHRPRMGDIELLVTGARTAGLVVDLRVDGANVPLPADMEFAAYRLVQEALTNVLKHAPGAEAKVLICNAVSHVDLTVVNSPVALAGGAPKDGGLGLRGMRQRVEASGGRLDWGRQPGGGFEIRARFPVAATR